MARYPDSLAAHGALIVAGTIINRPLCGMVYLDPKELPASASEKPVEDSAEKLTMEEEDPETDHW